MIAALFVAKNGSYINVPGVDPWPEERDARPRRYGAVTHHSRGSAAMTQHKLKCWTPYYNAIVAGDKKFDVRRDDRGFQKGDTVLLEQFNPKTMKYVMASRGRPYAIEKKIAYILTGGQFGIEPGYVVLGF